jgi:hypothetical protein
LLFAYLAIPIDLMPGATDRAAQKKCKTLPAGLLRSLRTLRLVHARARARRVRIGVAEQVKKILGHRLRCGASLGPRAVKALVRSVDHLSPGDCLKAARVGACVLDAIRCQIATIQTSTR